MAILNIMTDRDREFFGKALGPGNAHSWIMGAASRFKKYGVDVETAVVEIRRLFAKYAYREERRGDDLEGAVRRVYDDDSPRVYRAKIGWPAASPEAIEYVLKHYPPFFDLTPKVAGEDVLLQLFAPDELLCYSSDLYNATTAMAEKVAVMVAGLTFIVPSPMARPAGVTQKGTTSARSAENVGRRRYLIVEFDQLAGKERHAALLHYLSLHGALVMAVDSGGKSLHGWFDVEGWGEVETAGFFAMACSLGADPKMWAPYQWCRMPGGRRIEGRKIVEQSIVFYAGRP